VTKAGLEPTRANAFELAQWRIRVNCIAPGPVDTPIHATYSDDLEETTAIWAAGILGRIGRSRRRCAVGWLLAAPAPNGRPATLSMSMAARYSDCRRARVADAHELAEAVREVSAVLAQILRRRRTASATRSRRHGGSRYGVGREGLMMRALCMRLMHLGLDAHVVATATPQRGGAPAIRVQAAGSARQAGRGRNSEAKSHRGCDRDGLMRAAGLTTGDLDDPDTILSDAACMAFFQEDARQRPAPSILQMGSLYEAVQLLFFDVVSIRLRERLGQRADEMRSRHTNLE
jgi:6-phospho-3-hexuloisomerase